MHRPLTKRMYTRDAFGIEKEQLFGLSHDQMRGYLVQNAGWFNGLGERIGFGDLAGRDFRRISAEINQHEIFLVLREDKHNYRTPGVDLDNRGIDYVLQHLHRIIARGMCIVVNEYNQYKTPTVEQQGMTFQVATLEEAQKFVRGFLALHTRPAQPAVQAC